MCDKLTLNIKISKSCRDDLYVIQGLTKSKTRPESLEKAIRLAREVLEEKRVVGRPGIVNGKR